MACLQKNMILFNKKSSLKLNTNNKTIIIENKQHKKRNNTSFSYHLDLDRKYEVDKNRKRVDNISSEPKKSLRFVTSIIEVLILNLSNFLLNRSKFFKKASYIDNISRVIFPVTFALFHFIYWVYFMTVDSLNWQRVK